MGGVAALFEVAALITTEWPRARLPRWPLGRTMSP